MNIGSRVTQRHHVGEVVEIWFTTKGKMRVVVQWPYQGTTQHPAEHLVELPADDDKEGA